jgi:exopolyphosphatase/pppGpp-phosphohydrolase
MSFCVSCGIDTSLRLIQCAQKNLVPNTAQRDKVHLSVEDFFQSIFEVQKLKETSLKTIPIKINCQIHIAFLVEAVG